MNRKGEHDALAKEERRDNDGFLVSRRIDTCQSDLRSILKGAPRVVRNAIFESYGSSMLKEDFEESAWYAGYTGDIGEFLAVKEMDINVDKLIGHQESTPFYVACAMGKLELVSPDITTGLIQATIT
jgi:hypothetical protein